MPVQTPALKMLSMTEQLVISRNVLNIRVKGNILFIMGLLIIYLLCSNDNLKRK